MKKFTVPTLIIAALATAMVAGPPAAAQSSSDSGAAAGGTRPVRSASAAGPQTQTRPAQKRRVWTNADLIALRRDPSAQILVLESKRLGSAPPPQLRRTPAVSPEDVVSRYDELAKEAEKKVAELEREKLAGSNPFLRGLASQTGGPRPKDEIDADLERWISRREAARTNRDRAQRLTGARSTAPSQP